MEHKIRLLSKKRLNHDVSLFKFEKPLNFKFVPGHSIMASINKPSLIKAQIPLSFISENENPFIEFIIKNYPGKLTEQFHNLKIQDEIIMHSPFGSIRYTKPGVFIAGGIGIAPFMAIFRQLKKEEKLKGNKLIYSNKEKRDILFEEELKRLLGKENCIFTLTRENKSNYYDGRVNEEFLKKTIKNINQDFYVLGSEEFVKDVKESINKLK